ncbi:hypothetical protein Xvie_02162 [Xenorhabdus vietnamensis]|uniref:Uncharacterized protein n=1 Tax=Xenorhabdus vietnamensis TaxID=351656 RepID=A0A1Y2SCX1_9GAMM|nr:hypothetical protein Xvie_02162 [Xenorhabdus vietnamensis]
MRRAKKLNKCLFNENRYALIFGVNVELCTIVNDVIPVKVITAIMV